MLVIKQNIFLMKRSKRRRGEEMLVLSRKQGESIKIGENIELTIIEVIGDQIKVGIQAPKDIGIWRKELYDDIQQENASALSVVKDLFSILSEKK
jgi:carbon storage regulator